jgi:hypothetical protein
MTDEYSETIAFTRRAEEADETVALAEEAVALGDATAPADTGADAQTYVHFGPGVPVRKPSAPDRATALWRGEIDAADRAGDPDRTWRRRMQRWILPLTVLILVIAVLIYYFWGRTSTHPLSVGGARVQAAELSLGCGGAEHLTAIIQTNGGAGTITYRWLRSDGTSSEQLSQQVTDGQRQVNVELDWSFDRRQRDHQHSESAGREGEHVLQVPLPHLGTLKLSAHRGRRLGGTAAAAP